MHFQVAHGIKGLGFEIPDGLNVMVIEPHYLAELPDAVGSIRSPANPDRSISFQLSISKRTFWMKALGIFHSF
jgi:hypothetical protein